MRHLRLVQNDNKPVLSLVEQGATTNQVLDTNGTAGLEGAYRMRLDDATKRWLQSCAAVARFTPATMRGYQFAIDRFANTIGEDKEIGAVTTIDVEQWVITLAHLQPGSLRSAQIPIRSFFKWCIDHELISRNPMRLIPIPPKTKPTYRGIGEPTVRQLLRVANHREQTMVLLGLHLGMRCIEMERSRRVHWTPGDQTIWIDGKGNGERILPVIGEVEAVLSNWYGQRPAGPLFPSRRDQTKPLRASSISQMFTQLAYRAEVEVTHHQLRHTCAHHLTDNGSTVRAVQRFLGHESLASTAVYQAARDEELRAGMGRRYVWPEAS